MICILRGRERQRNIAKSHGCAFSGVFYVIACGWYGVRCESLAFITHASRYDVAILVYTVRRVGRGVRQSKTYRYVCAQVMIQGVGDGLPSALNRKVLSLKLICSRLCFGHLDRHLVFTPFKICFDLRMLRLKTSN